MKLQFKKTIYKGFTVKGCIFFFTKIGGKRSFPPFWPQRSEFLSDFDAYKLHFSEIAWRSQNSSSWSWATSFCLFPGFLVLEHIPFRKCFWETDKMKLDNFNINFFGNFKQFLKNLAYKRQNSTKTCWVMIKWIFEKIEVFNFFWK